MAIKNIYGEEEKKKNRYSSNTAAYSSSAALPHTRNTPQNNVWSAEQSAPQVQSYTTPQKPKRERTPSELGEEVVKTMLEDYAAEERQKQSAAGRTAQYGGSAARTKEAGNRNTVQYGNDGGQFRGQASYSSPSAAKPTDGKQKTTPYGDAAAVQYSTGTAAKAAAVPKAAPYAAPAAAMPTVRRREKTPSERGDEVVARVLVEEGIMDPKYLEGYLASFEEPSAQTFTDAGGSHFMGQSVNKLYSMQRNNRPVSPVQISGGNTDTIDSPLAWQTLAAQQYSAAVASDENGFEGTGDNNSAFSLDEPIDPVRPTPGEQTMAAIQEYPYLGQDPNMTWGGFWLGDKAKQLLDDTHIAPGMSMPLYWIDRGVNGGEMFLEGIWNYGVDSIENGAYFDLEQQKQQAQQRAVLGGPFQYHADFVSENVPLAQEKLPELAERFRSHEAAKHLQEIEEMYDAGGLIKIGGDTSSGLGQMGLAGLIGALTGGGGGLIALGASAAGNGATEARAGGADDNTAYMYGNLVGLVQVGTELWFGGIPGLPKGLLDNMLANIPKTNMGRLALKAATNALGEGAEEFISTMAEAYLAKLWNGDERGAWQTFEETFPDALYAAFQGATTSMIMNAPSNISNIQYARSLDAAIDVIRNGGTLTEAEIAAKNASLQYLTESWDEDSEWSRAAIKQWAAETRNWLPDSFHSDFQIIEIENEQNYRAVERGETTAFNDGRHPEINAQRITTYETPVYVSENATIKPKALHRINRYTEAAMELYNIPMERKPTVVIVSESEMPTAWGRYDAVNNVIYYSQWVESEQFTEARASVEYHEMWHMKQAEEFRQRGWVITEENYGQYIQELCKICEKRLDAAGISEYDIEKDISKYAQKNFFEGRFDEVEAEWRVREALK